MQWIKRKQLLKVDFSILVLGGFYLVAVVLIVFTVFMVIGRLVSGMHWFTDIVVGALFSAGLVTLYDAICQLHPKE